MIIINKNTTNNITLELHLIAQIATPYYLFEFVSEYTTQETKTYFTTPNISTYLNRYDEFILVDDDTVAQGNVDDAPINLNAGQYRYNIYVSSTPIDITDFGSVIANEPISTGRMLVKGINDEIDEVYDNVIPDTSTPSVYD